MFRQSQGLPNTWTSTWNMHRHSICIKSAVVRHSGNLIIICKVNIKVQRSRSDNYIHIQPTIALLGIGAYPWTASLSRENTVHTYMQAPQVTQTHFPPYQVPIKHVERNENLSQYIYTSSDRYLYTCLQLAVETEHIRSYPDLESVTISD